MALTLAQSLALALELALVAPCHQKRARWPGRLAAPQGQDLGGTGPGSRPVTPLPPFTSAYLGEDASVCPPWPPEEVAKAQCQDRTQEEEEEEEEEEEVSLSMPLRSVRVCRCSLGLAGQEEEEEVQACPQVQPFPFRHSRGCRARS